MRKRLYAIFWVDDYGSLKLRKKDVEWYHKNAGPISYALECDDRYPWSFNMILTSNNKFSYDYLAYHYHPIKWKGKYFPKKIYDFLKLHLLAYSLLRNYRNCKIPFLKMIRLRIILLFLAIAALALVYFAYFWNVIFFIILITLYIMAIGLDGIWHYVRCPKNWDYTISDIEWNKKFILKAKEEFEKRGFNFPKIIRHGWNLPWRGSMEFYKKLGVIADASAVPIGIDSHPKIANREIEWRLSQPYYASLEGDYSISWDGKDKKDKGLLELPVTLGNISAYGFGKKEKEEIEKIPDGGLVSIYIHPQDDFEPVKEWVKYLRENYDVKFISAENLMKIFSKDLSSKE